MPNTKRAVYVAGRLYGSISDAVEKLGHSRQLIHRSITSGRRGWYYKDTGQLEKQSTRSRGAPGRVVFVGGDEYPSVAEAASRLGMTRSKIIKQIEQGTPGTYYADEGPRPDVRKPAKASDKVVSGPKRKRGKQPIPIMLGGKRYASQVDAARKLKMSVGGIRRAIQREQNPTKIREGKPVEIDGKTYVSLTEAARAAGISLSAMSRREKARKERQVPVDIMGRKFDSIDEAAQATGLSVTVVARAVERAREATRAAAE